MMDVRNIIMITLLIIIILTMIKQLQDKIKNNQSIRKDLLQVQHMDQAVYIGKYKVIAFIGKGSFGDVYRGIDDVTSKEVAIKYVDKQVLWKVHQGQAFRLKIEQYLIEEQRLMLDCHSAFVIKLFQTLQNDKCKIFIMEYCEDGTLEHLINKKKALDEHLALQILSQIILALTQLHRQKVIHTNLRPEHVLQHKGIYKMADFGLSTKILFQEDQKNRTKMGCFQWVMAPQMMNGQKEDRSKAGIWSLGILYFMMIYPHQPYPLRHRKAQQMAMKGQDFVFKDISNNVITSGSSNFLKTTLEKDPAKRLSWEELLDHDIFKAKFDNLALTYIPCAQSPTISSAKKNIISQLFISQRQHLLKEQNSMISNPQSQNLLNLQRINELYLQCRKSEFILKEMINPIEIKQLLKFNKRSHIELLYLLISRCRQNIIYSKQVISIDYPPYIYQDFLQKITPMEEMINSKFQEYSFRLKKMQDQLSSILSDRLLKIFKKETYVQRQKFFNYFERVQFTKEEQISFTIERYIIEIINELQGNTSDEEKMKSVFKCYNRISGLKMEDLYDRTISQRIVQIIQEYA